MIYNFLDSNLFQTLVLIATAVITFGYIVLDKRMN